jgi:hypothetical protein
VLKKPAAIHLSPLRGAQNEATAVEDNAT